MNHLRLQLQNFWALKLTQKHIHALYASKLKNIGYLILGMIY